MAFGSRLSREEKLKIGKEFYILREIKKIPWPEIRASYRNISMNTAKKYIKDYKDSLVIHKEVVCVES